MGDYTYRTREEVEDWKTRCPIACLRSSIVESQAVPAAELEAIEAEIESIVDDAQKFAESSAWPEPQTAVRFVFDDYTAADPKQAPASSTPKNGPVGSPDTARQITYMQATFEALAEEMASNSAIFVMGEGVGKRGGNFKTTTGLYDLYGPERLRDTPICEQVDIRRGSGCGAP